MRISFLLTTRWESRGSWAFFFHRNGKELNEGIIYYIKKPKNENPLFLHASEVYGFTLHVNAFSALKKTLKVHFDTDCPQLVEILTKEEIKNKGLTHKLIYTMLIVVIKSLYENRK